MPLDRSTRFARQYPCDRPQGLRIHHGRGHANQGFSKFKAEFDKVCVTGWTLHDLRRTGRTLCSRAGAYPDHAELAYGHTVQGVRGVYDVWQDRDEKLRVLELLSAQIELIVNPQDNVVALRG